MQTIQNDNIKRGKCKIIPQMVVTINHEINNPLAGVLGNVELLLLDDHLDKMTRSKLTKIRTLSLRIRDVVREFTKINDPTSIKYCEQVDLIDIKRETTI